MEAVLSPHKGPYKCSVAISFDYETSTLTDPKLMKQNSLGCLFSFYNKYLGGKKDLSPYFGIGYATRIGAENSIKILKSFSFHGTWFAIGHALLKDNLSNHSYQVQGRLKYIKEDAGFSKSVLWRGEVKPFENEPKVGAYSFPYYFFGDQSASFRKRGEDIQCQTFSHLFLALESDENVNFDIMNWQRLAEENGFKKAAVLAFPYLGDIYNDYYNLNLKTLPFVELREEPNKVKLLSKNKVDILLENGIELVTRCGSKVQEEVLEGFAPYQESQLYYMSDHFVNIKDLKFDLFRRRIKEFIGGHKTINLWMHPEEIYPIEGKHNFKKMINYLYKKQEQKQVCVDTVSSLWDHFKKVRSCVLRIVNNGNCHEVKVVNNGKNSVKDLAIDFNVAIKLVGLSNRVVLSKKKVVIDHLASGEELFFNVEEVK